MYIQITTRCNMSCEHCCYACTAEGEDMSPEVYQAALKLAEENESFIAIGGGEPTLHPKFWHYLIDAIASDCDHVWLATNGSITKTALKLATLAKKGVIGCALSQDYYHDPIDESVVRAFTRHSTEGLYGTTENDGREIRCATNNEEHMSPFRDPDDGGNPENCPCSDIIVKPNGDVHLCGCTDSPKIGDVFSGYDLPTDEYDDMVECWQTLKREQEVA